MTQPRDESFLESPEFADLTPANRALLSHAFDHAGDPPPVTNKPSRKKRKTESIEPEDIIVDPEVEAGGGFLLEDNDEGGGFIMDSEGESGGFIVDEAEDGGGGFLTNDEDQNGGGFLPDPDIEVVESNRPDIPTSSLTNEPSSRSAKTHIPLSLIPRALKLANLPPSDLEVLEFFKQSAEGWSDETDLDMVGAASRSGGGTGSRRRVHQEKGVSRRDWFSVCAILLTSRKEEEMSNSNSKDRQDDEDEEEVEEDEDDDDDDDDDDEWTEDDPDQAGGFIAPAKLHVSEQDEDEDDIFNPNRRRTRRTTRSAAVPSPVPSLPSSDSDDNDGATYSESGASNRKSARSATGVKSTGKSKGRKTKRTLLDEDMIGDIDLTKGEKRKAKEAWNMFCSDNRKGSKVIGFKEVWEAARVLKEGWNETQVREMIASFSSAPDKSVLSLDDFEKLMWQGGMLA